ncbi:MAG: YihY/virulence factor BrkB family protein [Desulfosarcinaceae bacterium]|jgi:membrane protein
MWQLISKLVLKTVKAWWKDDIFRYAAAIAFYCIFSIAPIMLISLGIASIVYDEDKAKAQIVREIKSLTGGEGGKVVQQVFENSDLMRRNPTALVIGLAVVIFGSTAVFANLQASLNAIWEVRIMSQRSTWKTLVGVRIRSFGIVLAVGFLLLVSMIFSAVLNAVQGMLSDQLQQLAWLWRLVNILISFSLITLLFSMIYKYLPDVRIQWRDVIVGAAITSALFSLGKYLIAYYLGRVAVGSAYGAAGSFVIFLIWIYYSALICFFGAEFTHVYVRERGIRIAPVIYGVKSTFDLLGYCFQ